MKKKHRAPNPPKREAVPLPAPKRFEGAHRGIGHLIRCVILVLIVGIVYRNSFQSGFVLDSQFIIKLDPRTKEASWDNFKLIWQKDYWWPKQDTRAYRPIISTSYWLNWSVLGSGKHYEESEQVVGFHWLNNIAQGINAILAYLLLLKLLRRPWAAFFAAALFAIHPIGTEAVTNIVGRADEFVTMSFLACTVLYIRSTEARGLRRLPWILAIIVLFGLGCLSKESAPAFLAVPILYDGIYRWGSELYKGRHLRAILIDGLWYALLTVPLFAVLYIRSIVFRETPETRWPFVDNPIARFDWSDANSLSLNVHNWILGRLTACKVAAMGLWKLIWPAELSSDYSYNQIPLFEWQLSDMENIKAILAALLIAGTLAVAVWCYKRNKTVSFLILLAWIAYGPTANFLTSTGSIMGDRFFYLPSVAFCGLLVIGVDALARRVGASLEVSRESFKRPWPLLLPHGALLLILVLYGFRTYHRNFDWHSDVSLAEAAMKVSPRSFRAYGKLAEAYYQADPINNVDRIIELANKGVAIIDHLPNSENGTVSYMTLGVYYGLKGERVSTRTANGLLMMNDQTREWFEKSARVLERGSEIDLASNAIHRAREQERGKTNIADVGHSELYLYLGMSYERLGLDEKALETYKYMRHLVPMDPLAHLRVASTQLNLGRLEDAAVSLMQCLIVAPENMDPWPLLTEIYSQINQEPIPAVQPKDGRPQLREDNKLVQRHLFQAYTGFMKIVQLAEQREILKQTREVAENLYHFDSRLIDEVLKQPVARPAPPAPVFHTYGKKLVDETTERPAP